MADKNNNVIGILFGVAGEDNISTGSGRLIKTQLQKIAGEIGKTLTVKITPDKDHFKTQVEALKKELDKALGNITITIKEKAVEEASKTSANRAKNGKKTTERTSADSTAANGSKQAAKENVTYNKVRNTLERLYRAKVRVAKLSTVNEKENISKAIEVNQEKELKELYEKQFEALKNKFGAESEEVKKINDFATSLDNVSEAQEKVINNAKKGATLKTPTATDIAKLQNKAASLYTTKGYDKLIESSPAARRAVGDFNAAVKAAVAKKGGMTPEEYENLTAMYESTETYLRNIGAETDTLYNKTRKAFNSGLVQNFANILISYVVAALKEVVQNVVELDKAVTDLQIATGKTRAETVELVRSYADLGKQLGATISEVSSAADTWLRQGYSIAETNELIANTLMLAKLGQLESAEAAKALTSAMKGYKIAAEDSLSIVDKLTAVDMEAAVSSGDIATAMAETAAGAEIAGLSMDKLIGYISVVSEVTQDGAESVGNFYKTLFARMGNIKTGRFIDDDTGESLNDVEATLNKIGIALRNNSGTFKDFGSVLDEVGEKWGTLSNIEQHALATAFAGTRQQEKFIVLMENYATALEYANVAETSQGTAEYKYGAAYLDSIEAKFEALKTSWQKFSMALLNSDVIKRLVENLALVVDKLADITKIFNGWPSTMAAATIAMKALFSFADSKKITALRDFFSELNKGIKEFKTLSELSKEVKDPKALEDLDELAKRSKETFHKLGNSILPLIVGVIVSFTSSLEGPKKAIASVMLFVVALTTAIVSCTKVANAAVQAFMRSNIVGIILSLVALVINMVLAIRDAYKQAKPSLEDLKNKAAEAKEAWKEAKDELQEVKDKIQEVQDAIDELNAKGKKSLTDEAELKRLEQELKILQIQKELAEDVAALKRDEAWTATERAINKLVNWDSDYFKFDFKDSLMSTNADRIIWAKTQIADLTSILSGYEYGDSSIIDKWLDYYYDLLDVYTMVQGSKGEAFNNIFSRVKYQDAIAALEELMTDKGSITAEAVKELSKENDDVANLFNHLKEIGFWDGEDWEKLASQFKLAFISIEELSLLDIADGLDGMVSKFNSLKEAIEDVKETGAITAETLKTLAEENPLLLDKYFTKTETGYTLNEDYKDKSNFEILKGLAVDELTSYQNILNSAQDTLSKLKPGEEGYAEALENVAIAQDNLNTKSIQWASILREAGVEEETERLEGLQETLEEQLDVYKDLIEIRKDLLTTYKEEVDYQKELEKKQKKVVDLQTELALARLDNSAAGQARVRELETQLQEAQDELDEYTLERAVETLTKTLDDEYSEYERFIDSEVEKISGQLENIAALIQELVKEVISGYVSDVSGSSTNEEKVELYNKIDEAWSNPDEKMANHITTDVVNFSALMSGGNAAMERGDYKTAIGKYAAADKYYAGAKEAYDAYLVDKDKKSPDEILKDYTEMGWMEVSESAKYDGYYNVETIYRNYSPLLLAEKEPELTEALNSKEYPDGTVFKKGGELYGYLSGKAFKLYADKWNSEAYKLFKEKCDIYHSGGFVGDFVSLKSNEEFAKLLNGELVATPKQMDDFMKQILPDMLNYKGGYTVNNNSPLVEIKCDTITKEALPELKKIVDLAVQKIEKNMESALSRTGFRKNY